MHIPNMHQILLVFTRNTERLFPLVNHFKNLGLISGHENWRTIWETLDEFVEELFGADLQMKRVTAILDEHVKKLRSGM